MFTEQLKMSLTKFIVVTITIAFVMATITTAQQSAQKQSTPESETDESGRLQLVQIDEVVSGKVYDLIQRGNRLARAERYDEAIAEYKSALEKSDKPIFTIYLNLGAVYFQKQDYKAAVEAYRKAETVRTDSRVSFYIAEVLFSMGEYREAEAGYRKAIELTPGGVNPPAHHFLALSLYGQQRIDEAIAEHRIAIEQSGGNYAEAHYNLGIALMARNENKAAEDAFRRAIKQEKKDWPEAHFNLANVLERQRRFNEAASEYEIYLKKFPAAEDAQKIRQRINWLRQQK